MALMSVAALGRIVNKRIPLAAKNFKKAMAALIKPAIRYLEAADRRRGRAAPKNRLQGSENTGSGVRRCIRVRLAAVRRTGHWRGSLTQRWPRIFRITALRKGGVGQ